MYNKLGFKIVSSEYPYISRAIYSSSPKTINLGELLVVQLCDRLVNNLLNLLPVVRWQLGSNLLML
jgi:hypothetical protein